jgi:four helix bundle suffix protein
MAAGARLFSPPSHAEPDAKRYLATFRKGIENSNPEIAANVILGLVRVTNYLLDRQLGTLERAFLAEGGLRERMTRARLQKRNQRT